MSALPTSSQPLPLPARRTEVAESKAIAKEARDEAVRLQREAKVAQGAAHDAVQKARWTLAALGFQREQTTDALASAVKQLVAAEPLVRHAAVAREAAVTASERFLELARVANRTSHEAGHALPFQVAKNVRDLFDVKALAVRGQAQARELAELSRRFAGTPELAGFPERMDALAASEAAASAKSSPAAAAEVAASASAA